jgi:hypothetical protein
MTTDTTSTLHYTLDTCVLHMYLYHTCRECLGAHQKTGRDCYPYCSFPVCSEATRHTRLPAVFPVHPPGAA